MTVCIKKLYRMCGTNTQWLNHISKRNLNEHEHNKDNLQSKNNEKCEHLRFCEDEIPSHSAVGIEKLLTLAVSSSVYQENEVLELQFSCLRELLSLSLSSSFLVCVFIYKCTCLYACGLVCAFFIPHTHHTRTLSVSSLPVYGKQTKGIA